MDSKEASFFCKNNIHHWQRNGSYKIIDEFFDTDASLPTNINTYCYDGDEGIASGTGQTSNFPDQMFGRIDSTQNPAVSLNEYLCWLQNMWFPESVLLKKGSFIFPALLEQKESWKITAPYENDKILLTAPFFPDNTDWYATYSGSQEIVIDPEKKFMPIFIEKRWVADFKEFKQSRLKHEIIRVEDSCLEGGMWMPTQLTVHTLTSEGGKKISFTQLNVVGIQHGGVTAKDVELIFPDNTRVVDVNSGTSYMTNADGKPIEATVDPLHGLDPTKIKMPGTQTDRKLNYIFMIFGLGMIVVALYLQFKKRKRLA